MTDRLRPLAKRMARQVDAHADEPDDFVVTMSMRLADVRLLAEAAEEMYEARREAARAARLAQFEAAAE